MIQEARSRLVVATSAGIAGFAVVACGNTGDLHLQGTTAKPGVTTNQYHAQGITKTNSENSANQFVKYKTYQNSRFGFTVDYPSSWTAGPKPENNDGMSWFINAKAPSFKNTISPGHPNDAELIAVGVPNALMGSGAHKNFSQMLSAVRNQVVPSMKKEAGIVSIQYGVSDGWIWITSMQRTGKNTTIYTKQYLNVSTVQTLQVIYPSSQQNTYESVLSHVEQSFNPGNGK